MIRKQRSSRPASASPRRPRPRALAAGGKAQPGKGGARPPARTSKAAPARARPAHERPAGARAPRTAASAASRTAARNGRPQLQQSLLEIIRRTSAELPADVIRAVERGRAQEAAGGNARWAMDVIHENIDLARDKSQPLCQDTGTIIFFVKAPRGFDARVFRKAAESAVQQATARGYLRQNSVDSLTGRNSGNNLGPGSPVVHVQTWDKQGLDVRLVLKGGGCENVGAQYSLPDGRLGADRNLAGVEKCILDAVFQAQGKGCGPGVMGVTVGGDRATGYEASKEQFLRTLDDTNPVPELAALESRVVEKSNQLGIGPMGFGGKTTLLGCKIAALNRLPASYFVSISYMCWAYRRQGAELDARGAVRRWLY